MKRAPLHICIVLSYSAYTDEKVILIKHRLGKPIRITVTYLHGTILIGYLLYYPNRLSQPPLKMTFSSVEIKNVKNTVTYLHCVVLEVRLLPMSHICIACIVTYLHCMHRHIFALCGPSRRIKTPLCLQCHK